MAGIENNWRMDRELGEVMSEEIKTGGPAFPIAYEDDVTRYVSHGLSMRDYFAAQAMSSLIAEEWAPKDCARQAYEFADAMLKARGQ